MKISIRFSILSILLSLLIGTSLCIVGINYFFLDKILIKTAKDSMNHAGGKVSEQISRYLQPLDQLSYLGTSLIEENVVTPGPTDKFTDFLYKFLLNKTKISSIYWADAAGNFYLLEKTKNNTISSENILSLPTGKKSIEKTYDLNMNLLSSKESLNPDFDPSLRPWYQQVNFKKKHVWLVYPMVHFGSQQMDLGITAAHPVYDSSKNLVGVFGMDIPLKEISDFVKNIKTTKNSIVFVCDTNGNLFSAYSTDVGLLKDYRMPKITNLDLPWITMSFDLYRKHRQPIFVFEYGGEKYVAAYDAIPGIKSEAIWNIAIITPMQDILAPLQKSIILSLFLVLGALVFGISLAAVFSSRISQPIIKLTKDSELICQLKLEEVKQLFSRIKEISYMADSFIKMKNALHSFQRYMPVALVKNLVASGKIADVGGETKKLTLLFSDIENFTTIAEKMSPQEVMEYLSEYFEVIAKAVLSTGGTIDKYIGDGIMAFWGAPMEDQQHAAHACKAALKIKNDLEKLNEKWLKENKPQTTTRIGINTDLVIAGNVGSEERLNYTALGDGVNLASRLEGLNKNYDTHAMVGENTFNLAKDEFNFRLVDKVAVKGKTQGVYIYELSETKHDNLEQYNKLFKIAFGWYEQGNWEKAIELFSELLENNKQDLLLKIFIKRCQKLTKNPPKDWCGVWIIEDK